MANHPVSLKVDPLALKLLAVWAVMNDVEVGSTLSAAINVQSRREAQSRGPDFARRFAAEVDGLGHAEAMVETGVDPAEATSAAGVTATIYDTGQESLVESLDPGKPIARTFRLDETAIARLAAWSRLAGETRSAAATRWVKARLVELAHRNGEDFENAFFAAVLHCRWSN